MPNWPFSFEGWFRQWLRDSKHITGVFTLNQREFTALKESCRCAWEASRQNMTTRGI